MEVAQHEAAVFQRGGRPWPWPLAMSITSSSATTTMATPQATPPCVPLPACCARVLRESAREIDHVARWGGEEFLILLPATDGDEALSVCGRLRESVHGLSAQNVAGSDVGMSITLRVAVQQTDEPIEQALLQPAVPCTKASKRAATVRFWRDRKPWSPYNQSSFEERCKARSAYSAPSPGSEASFIATALTRMCPAG